jgi:hypothetical protein
MICATKGSWTFDGALVSPWPELPNEVPSWRRHSTLLTLPDGKGFDVTISFNYFKPSRRVTRTKTK